MRPVLHPSAALRVEQVPGYKSFVLQPQMLGNTQMHARIKGILSLAFIILPRCRPELKRFDASPMTQPVSLQAELKRSTYSDIAATPKKGSKFFDALAPCQWCGLGHALKLQGCQAMRQETTATKGLDTLWLQVKCIDEPLSVHCPYMRGTAGNAPKPRISKASPLHPPWEYTLEKLAELVRNDKVL